MQYHLVRLKIFIFHIKKRLQRQIQHLKQVAELSRQFDFERVKQMINIRDCSMLHFSTNYMLIARIKLSLKSCVKKIARRVEPDWQVRWDHLYLLSPSLIKQK